MCKFQRILFATFGVFEMESDLVGESVKIESLAFCWFYSEILAFIQVCAIPGHATGGQRLLLLQFYLK